MASSARDLRTKKTAGHRGCLAAAPDLFAGVVRGWRWTGAGTPPASVAIGDHVQPADHQKLTGPLRLRHRP